MKKIEKQVVSYRKTKRGRELLYMLSICGKLRRDTMFFFHGNESNTELAKTYMFYLEEVCIG